MVFQGPAKPTLRAIEREARSKAPAPNKTLLFVYGATAGPGAQPGEQNDYSDAGQAPESDGATCHGMLCGIVVLQQKVWLNIRDSGNPVN